MTQFSFGMDWVIVYIIREDVPPTLFFFSEELDGHWVSQSTRLVAPSRGLEGGRWSGLTPPKKLLVVEGRGEVVKPSEEELGGVGGAEGGGGIHAPEGSNFFPKKIKHQESFVQILLSLSKVKVKFETCSSILFSKQVHVIRA